MAATASQSVLHGQGLCVETPVAAVMMEEDKENIKVEAGNGQQESQAPQTPSSKEQILAAGIEVYRKVANTEAPPRGLLKKSTSDVDQWVLDVKKEDGSTGTFTLAEFCGLDQEDEDLLDVLLCSKTHLPIRSVLEELDAQGQKWSPDKERTESVVGMKRAAARRPLSKDKGDASAKKKAKSESASGAQDLTILQPFNVPQWRFTPLIPDPRGVTLSPYDRAPQLRLAEENLTVSGHKGYRLIRATHGVTEGAWYCEVTIREDYVKEVDERTKDGKEQAKILESAVKGHSRFGWARSGAYMQAPVGYDRFGYALCSRTGHTVHMRTLSEYTEPLKEGDVVGCYLYLPTLPKKEDGEAVAEQEGATGEGGESAKTKEEPEGSGAQLSGNKEEESSSADSAGAPKMIAEVENAKAGEAQAVNAEGGAAARASAGDKNTEGITGEEQAAQGADESSQEGGGEHDEEAPGLMAPREPLLWRDTGAEFYLDEDEDTTSDIHPGSVLRFYVNGKPCGLAYENLQQGKYYPAVGLYYAGQVTYNFGPDFKFPLHEQPNGVSVSPVSELAKEDLEKARLAAEDRQRRRTEEAAALAEKAPMADDAKAGSENATDEAGQAPVA